MGRAIAAGLFIFKAAKNLQVTRQNKTGFAAEPGKTAIEHIIPSVTAEIDRSANRRSG